MFHLNYLYVTEPTIKVKKILVINIRLINLNWSRGVNSSDIAAVN